MNKEQQAQRLKLCTQHFFTHPHWDSVVALINDYLEDLKGIDSIDIQGKTSDEVATELRARQITFERLNKFVEDSLTLKKVAETVPKSKRKFK